jgi:hypothetical protein
MGESNELSPYCIVTELEIKFDESPVDSIAELSIPLEECIFNSVYKY